jgi:hypothetical protein
MFKQHLLETFFQPKVGEMEINETHTQIRVQIFTLLYGLSQKKINLGFEENLQ